MSDIGKRLRGMLTFGVLGSLGGAVAGLVWWVAEITVGLGSLALDSFRLALVLWTGFGFLAGVGSAMLLSRYAGANRLADLSTTRASLFGAVAGALAPVLLVLVVGAGLSVEALFVSLLSGGLGAGIAGGITAIGKAAPDDQLTAGEPDHLLGD